VQEQLLEQIFPSDTSDNTDGIGCPSVISGTWYPCRYGPEYGTYDTAKDHPVFFILAVI